MQKESKQHVRSGSVHLGSLLHKGRTCLLIYE